MSLPIDYQSHFQPSIRMIHYTNIKRHMNKANYCQKCINKEMVEWIRIHPHNGVLDSFKKKGGRSLHTTYYIVVSRTAFLGEKNASWRKACMIYYHSSREEEKK